MKFRPAFWLIHLIITVLLVGGILWIGPQLTYKGYAFLQNIWLQAAISGALMVLWAAIHLRLKPAPEKTIEAKQAETEAASAETVPALPDKTSSTLPLKNWNQQFPESTHLPIIFIAGDPGVGKSALLAQAGSPLAQVTQKIELSEITWHLYQKLIAVEWNETLPLSAWSALLKMLQPWQKNIQGFLYCLAGTTSATKDSAMLQQQLTEIRQRFKRDIPLYIVLTQLDTLKGFNAFFSQLSNKRLPLLSITATGDKPDTYLNTLVEQLHHIITALKQYRFADLHLSRPVMERISMYAFPHHFAKLSSQLEAWLKKLLVDLPDYRMLKAVYFTTQASDIQNTRYSKDFWPQILKQMGVINTTYFQNRKHRQSLITWLITLGFSITLMGLWSNSYLQQKQQLQNLNQAVQQTGLLQPIQIATWYHELAKQNLWSTAGLTVNHKLLSILATFYAKRVSYDLIPALQNWFKQDLPQQTGIELYRDLKAYLMLGDLSHRNPKQLKRWLEFNQSNLAAVPELANKMPELQNFIQSNQVLPLDSELITDARVHLQQLPQAELTYLILQDTVAEENRQAIALTEDQGILLRQVFELDQSSLFIPAIYTKSWFLTRYPVEAKRAETETYNADWVMGKPASTVQTADADLHQAVTRLYLDDYVAVWQQHLNILQVKPLQNLLQAAQVVTLLAQPNSPFDLLLDNLNKNTDLNFKSDNSSSAQINQLSNLNSPDLLLGRSYFNAAFGMLNEFTYAKDKKAAVGYAAIKADLQQLGQQLTQLANQPAPDKAILKLVMQHFAGNTDDALGRLQQNLEYTPQPLQSWLQQLLDNVWQLLLNSARQQLDTQWQQQVMPFYQKALADRYPLNSAAENSVSLADFNQFFGPDGIFAQFYKQYLQVFIDENTQPWQWRTVAGHTIGLSDDLLQQLQKAEAIQQAFFADGAKQTQISFDIKPEDLSATAAQVKLTIGGQTLVYGHGPQQYTHFNLPAQDSDTALIWVDLQGQEHRNAVHDAWGWFRLLQHATVKNIQDGWLVTFRQGMFYASFTVKANSAFNPFSLQSLNLTLPGSINKS